MAKQTIKSTYILKLLEGKWSLSRTLENSIDSKLSAEANGETTIEIVDDRTLSYLENVKTLFKNKIEIKGKASYKFQLDDGKLHQYTNDENYMFELEFFTHNSERHAQASYMCGQDRYNVEYIFRNNDNFTVTYEVLGPNKNYTTNTNFERVSIS